MRPRLEPVEAISFAARHGFITKSLFKAHLAKGTDNWKNRRWKYLTTSGLFRELKGHGDLLVPNANHPLVMEVAGTISKPPRLDQLAHDKIVALTDLQLRRSIKGLTTIVEAEAKRRDSLNFESILSIDADKYPDLSIDANGFEVAIEIEISMKSKARYREVLERYLGSAFELVIYVVGSRDLKLLIEDIASEVGIEESTLAFSGLTEWSKDPLKAQLAFPKEVTNLMDLLNLD